MLDDAPLSRVCRDSQVFFVIIFITVFFLFSNFLNALLDASVSRFTISLDMMLRIIHDLRQVIVVLPDIDVGEVREVGAGPTHTLVAVVNSIEIRCIWTPLGAISMSLRNSLIVIDTLVDVFALNSKVLVIW